eukprot:10352299-Heterocapsa_arctica.AAC.1
MQRCLHKEGLLLQEALSSMLNIDLPLLALENLQHLARVQRTCVGSLHEAFFSSVKEDPPTGEVDAQP